MCPRSAYPWRTICPIASVKSILIHLHNKYHRVRSVNKVSDKQLRNHKVIKGLPWTSSLQCALISRVSMGQ